MSDLKTQCMRKGCRQQQTISSQLPPNCLESLNVSIHVVSRVQVQSTTTLPASMTAVNSPSTVQVETQQMDQFKEVTAGVDRIYSIPSTSLQHQGTYQCEIYSGQHFILRLYYYLTVTPQAETGHTELQEIFDLSLLPGGQLLPVPGGPFHSPLLPSSLLLTNCLTSLLVLLFLSLGALYLSKMPERTSYSQQHADGDEDLGSLES